MVSVHAQAAWPPVQLMVQLAGSASARDRGAIMPAARPSRLLCCLAIAAVSAASTSPEQQPPAAAAAQPATAATATGGAAHPATAAAAGEAARRPGVLVTSGAPKPATEATDDTVQANVAAAYATAMATAKAGFAQPSLKNDDTGTPLLLVAAAASAAAASGAAPPPAWGGPCRSALDCSLNGVCQGGACACDVGFTGERCERFDFQPTPAGSAFHSPDAGGATSSWGGTAAYDPASKLWHGFFSEFVGGCGVLSWETNSQIVRGVASTPLGPFARQGVAIAAESHNAEARRDPNSGEWLLLHIGDGGRAGTTSAAGSSSSVQCTNGSTASCHQCADAPFYRCENKNFPWRCCTNYTVDFPKGNATAAKSILHHAKSPLGPWKPLSKSLSLANLQPKFCSDNPTSYIAPNGTMWVLAVCHLPGSTAAPRGGAGPSGGEGLDRPEGLDQEGLPSVLMLWRADAWDGEFVQIGNVTRSNGPKEKQWSWVDPTIWVDLRGNVHVVANMGYDGDACRPIGSHTFSEDGGRNFHTFCAGNPTEPGVSVHPIWNGTTDFADGSTRWLHFERPKIVLDPESGRPIALFSSVGSHCANLTTDRSWTIARPIRTSLKLDDDCQKDLDIAALPCKTHLDCELNGVCRSFVCHCYRGWTGPTCGTLDLLPARRAGAWPATRPIPPEYWGDGATPVGWGGSIVRGDDGRYHIFAASGCFIPSRVMHVDGWSISHGVADAPDGPYEYVGGTPGSSASSFNPHATRLPDGRWLLYFVGAHSSPTPSGYAATCTGNETKPSSGHGINERSNKPGTCNVADCFSATCQPAGNGDGRGGTQACIDAGCIFEPGFHTCVPPDWNTSSSIHVSVAHSPEGPWNTTGVKLTGITGVPKMALQVADNPSPLVLPDATSRSGYRILLAFRFPGNDSFCGTPRCSPSVIGMAEAFRFDGPHQAYAPSYERAGEVLPFPPVWDGAQHGDGSEDPTMFRGPNNTIHMLVHKYTNTPAQMGKAPGQPGLHGFSLDGRHWHVSKQVDRKGAYTFEVEWSTDGGGEAEASTVVGRRERPELTVDEEGLPLFLTTGVELSGHAHQYSFVLVQNVSRSVKTDDAARRPGALVTSGAPQPASTVGTARPAARSPGWAPSWDTLPVFIHSSNESGDWLERGLAVLAKATAVTFDKFSNTNDSAHPHYTPTCADDVKGCVSKCRGDPLHCAEIAAACGCVGKPTPECDQTARMVAKFARLKVLNPNVRTLANISSCANFPHYWTATQFAANPKMLLHDTAGKLITTHVPGFSWRPNVSVMDVTQKAARDIIIGACITAIESGEVDGFFFDRVDDGCFQRDYGKRLDPVIDKALPAARRTLVQEVQAAIGKDKLVVANHMFELPNVTGAMNEAWGVRKNPEDGAKAIWQNLAECEGNDKLVEAHCSSGPTDDTVAAILIGAGPLALFGSGGWSFKGDGGPVWVPEYYDRPLGKPIGPATAETDAASGNVTMVRTFSTGTVARFCVNTSKGDIAWSGPIGDVAQSAVLAAELSVSSTPKLKSDDERSDQAGAAAAATYLLVDLKPTIDTI